MKYLAIICDIKKSKEAIIDRKIDVISFVQKGLDTINDKYRNLLEMNFTITIGDEFQALLSLGDNSQNVFELVNYLSILLHPLKFRIGLGIGELTKDSRIQKNQSTGTNGEAWWNARDMIVEVQEKYEKKVNVLTNIRIKGFRDASTEDLVNLLLMGLYRIQKKWKEDDYQLLKSIIESMGMYSGFKQVELAKKIKISEKAISRRLNKMNFYYYISATEKINNLIGKELAEND